MTKFDAIIIGSGQAGNPLARKLAAAGWKIAIIERKWVGGTCVNVGCTPTKTLIASGKVAWMVQKSADYGIHHNGFTVNIEEVIRRKNTIILSSRESNTLSLLKSENIKLLFGNAAFSAVKEITVTKEDGSTEVLSAETIFINAGTHPKVPDIPGLDRVKYYTSDSLIDLLEIPSHLVILGGSYIALEFGQLYRRLGSEVTILEHGDHFLPKEEPEIASALKKILEDDGIKILTAVKLKQVAQTSGEIRIEVETPPGSYVPAPSVISASHLLLAAGRDPNTAGLNAKVAGVALDEHGFVSVNHRLETNVPGIYALGDVNGGPQFTHISYNDYLVVYKNLVEQGQESTRDRLTIYCMFTDPEFGRIGLTEKQARDQGIDVEVATMPATRIARGIENGETRGMIKAIVNKADKKIVGASVLTPGGGELMTVLQMAMLGGITYDKIRDMIFAHPTFAEALNNLFAGLGH